MVAGTCFAQNEPPPKFYKLDFVVKEVEGAKVINSRAYSMTASTSTKNTRSSIRTGSKVPLQQGASMTFLDVGVNIDCFTLKEEQNEITLNVSADISSILQDTTTPAYPVVRQNRWQSDVIVPIKKSTVIFASDDYTTKRQMQIELTATPIGN
jgi:hypothetical protein